MSYATVDQLTVVLKKRNPSTDEQEAMQRVLDAATAEIDSELGRTVDDPEFTDEQLALVVGVNLDRAQEHFQQEQVPFGILPIGEFGARITSDTWRRHADKLAPLKLSWGLA